MTFAGINYLAVIVAGIAGWMIGAAWYMTLAKPWMAAVGKSRDDIAKSNTPAPYVVAFVALMVMAWVLAGLIGHLGPGEVTLWNGVVSGAFVWLGFVITTLAVNHGFGGAKPMLTAIDGGHWLLVLVVQGAIIGGLGV